MAIRLFRLPLTHGHMASWLRGFAEKNIGAPCAASFHAALPNTFVVALGKDLQTQMITWKSL